MIGGGGFVGGEILTVVIGRLHLRIRALETSDECRLSGERAHVPDAQLAPLGDRREKAAVAREGEAPHLRCSNRETNRE